MLCLLFTSTSLNSRPETYHAMVVSDHALASEVGADILKQGGNAIDAAVAIGYALAVVQPCCGNLGGGGFMLIHFNDDRQEVFLNFREKAPLAAHANMFEETQNPNASLIGFLAVATPGTVLGLETAHKRYGKLSREALISPAIKLAKEGFKLKDADAELIYRFRETLVRDPNVAKIFFTQGSDGLRPLRAGENLVQANLATTLTQILEKGPYEFYQGSIAKKIIEASQKRGGILSLEDFKSYQQNQVELLKPLQCQYRDYQLVTAPLPSSGGIVLCKILQLLEPVPLTKFGFHSKNSVLAIVDAMDQGFKARMHLGDPHAIPITTKSSKPVSDKFDEKTLDKELNEEKNTTHYGVVDSSGNWVLVTYTINSLFGAKVIAGDTGFFLNNEMDDFTTRKGVSNQFGLIQGEENKIEPGKIPLSSMSPTLVMKAGKPILGLGAAGGPRIITANLQTLLNVIDYQMSIAQAVQVPRFHSQYLPRVVAYETGSLKQDVIDALKNRGYLLTLAKELGIQEAIQFNLSTQSLMGASDHRRSTGLAIGLP